MFTDMLEGSVQPEADAEGNKLVSILIPTFNRERFLEIALTSAAAQTYPNTEIIVVDNCSTDGSWEVITDFASRFSNIRAYRQDRNYGVHANFKASFELARGYYHKWLMSDDVLGVDCTSLLVQMLEAQPSATIASSPRLPIDEHSQILPNISATIPLVGETGYFKGGSVIEHVLVEGINRIGEPSTVLYRAQDINASKYFLDENRTRWIYDVDLWIDLLKRGDLAYVNTPLSFFRIHEGQDQMSVSVQEVLREWLLLIQECWLEGVIPWERAASAVASQMSWLSNYLRNCDGAGKQELLPQTIFVLEVYEAICMDRNLEAPLCFQGRVQSD